MTMLFKSVRRIKNEQTKIYITIISALGALSAFMPWASVGVFGNYYNFSGVEEDGKITLLLFILVGVLCFIGNKKEKLSQHYVYGLWAISGINILVIFLLFSKVNELFTYVSRYTNASVAHGAYMTLLCAVGVLLFSIDSIGLTEKVDGWVQTIKKNK